MKDAWNSSHVAATPKYKWKFNDCSFRKFLNFESVEVNSDRVNNATNQQQ